MEEFCGFLLCQQITELREIWAFDSSVGGSHKNKREAQPQGENDDKRSCFCVAIGRCRWLYHTQMKQNAQWETLPPPAGSIETGRHEYLFLCCSLRLNVRRLSSGHRVNDGLWHTVSLDTRDLQIALTLDSEPTSTTELWEQLDSRGSFYFGGKWGFCSA